MSEPWTVEPADAGRALVQFLRARTDRPWRELKRFVAEGKVWVDGAVLCDEGARLRAGQSVELRMSAPRPKKAVEGPAAEELAIVFEDTHLVVVDKPVGISSVPFEKGAERSAMDLVRELWKRRGQHSGALHKVHRIDKVTSGLLVYARTNHAREVLYQRFKRHEIERAYLCVANGRVPARTIDLAMVADRGDGLRWVGQSGKPATSHVAPLEPLRGATLCKVTLETGRTHQIRIHMAATGHPLVGEHIYQRDLANEGAPLLPAPRLMLHATLLGFPHPATGAPLRFECPAPQDFQAVVDALRST